MAQSIDQSYLKEYSGQFAERICSGFFADKQYITGNEIISLTACRQLNLMVIKSLFGAWQSELEKLKKNPFFDYGSEEVAEALRDFMNVLSQSIKVSRVNFQPLLLQAVEDTVLFAVDPRIFLEIELAYSAGANLEVYFKENKKYIKWHTDLWSELVQATERFSLPESLSMAFDELVDKKRDRLADPQDLLKPLSDITWLDLDRLTGANQPAPPSGQQGYQPLPELKIPSQSSTPSAQRYDEEQPSIALGQERIDPALAWARFERESYGLIKGSVRKLSEDIGINQRFMFTRKLFFGNPENLNAALSDLDATESFFDAVELLNEKYIAQLGWDLQSEELIELLFLIFLKFDVKN
ncbi:hypothetical protein [Lunatimonas lonarensis]|nr:hypothetical protein [Lunatimonas lonarensis]